MRSIALRLTAAFLLLTVIVSILGTTVSRFSAPMIVVLDNKNSTDVPWWAAPAPAEDYAVADDDYEHEGHQHGYPPDYIHAHGAGHFDLGDELPAALVPISIDELESHAQEGSAWVAIDGIVYDVTDYAEFHPGGPDVLREHAGTDVTRTFNAIHAPGTISRLAPEYRVGVLQL
ncbi:Cytochrome b2, mitochondrial [Vanrija pseudolonga]|uniref:Cytochrome b2, mitochondrial n=1 Tax=Vanrija pseudolonga TaxID=143232 RepID=A0AAF1BS35_9TREE|nr:Cytochrome b2, mitochondrial [Vanrija pseudolonga]